MDADNRDLLTHRAWFGGTLSPTMHGRDRATKHEHQAKGEKDLLMIVVFILVILMRVFRLSLQC